MFRFYFYKSFALSNKKSFRQGALIKTFLTSRAIRFHPSCTDIEIINRTIAYLVTGEKIFTKSIAGIWENPFVAKRACSAHSQAVNCALYQTPISF